jgi:hypothetical protein
MPPRITQIGVHEAPTLLGMPTSERAPVEGYFCTTRGCRATAPPPVLSR